MKKRILSLFTSLVMAISLSGVLPAMSVGAEESGDYEYEILDDGTVEITYYDGSATSLTIPSTIDGKKVTSIAYSAFYNRDSLTSVTIPDSVTSIGDWAFFYCESLTNITIPDSIISMGGGAFDGTPFLENQTTDVKYVGKWAVDCDGYATSVSIKSGTIGIAGDAFAAKCDDESGEYNSNLKEVTIPNSVTTIGNGAFYNCDSLTSVTIPGSVTSIGAKAFGYHWLDDYGYYSIKINGFKIFCYADTAGEKYAIDNGFDYELIEHNHTYSTEWTIDKAATCTSEGSKSHHCTICGAKKDITAIAKTAHNYNTTIVKPTYAGQGYTLHKCTVCGDSYKDTYTNQLVLANVSGLKMTKNTDTAITMSWNKVNGATGYVVYQAIDGIWQRIKVTSGNSLTVSNLKAGTNYRFTVKAYKTVGGTNYYSQSYTGVWMTTAPANITKASFTTSANAVKMSWSKVNGATGYIVYKYDTTAKSYKRVATTKSTSYTFSKLASGTTYKFTVRAYKTYGGKNYLSPKYTNFTTTTNPATVNFKLTAGSKKATVSWNKVNGATGYIVYYKTSAKGSWQRLKTTTGTSYTKTGLTKGKTYYFTVKAYRTVNGKTYNGSFTTKSVKVK